MKRIGPNQHDKILAALRSARDGKSGREGKVSNVELQSIAFQYTGRISELRAMGYVITCHRDRNAERGSLRWYSLDNDIQRRLKL